MGKVILFIFISGALYFFSSQKPANINHPTIHSPVPAPIDEFATVEYAHAAKGSKEFYDSIFNANQGFEAEGFDFPVGKPDAANYFNAQTFGENYHLGEDWNGKGGGNTDLGDPVYATANGLVTFTDDVCCGWGNVVRIIHKLPNHPEYRYVESLYAHMHNFNVKNGDLVSRGQQIGTIGTAHGRYSAHLHFELRDMLNLPIGQGYSDDRNGYIAPTEFINKNRPVQK